MRSRTDTSRVCARCRIRRDVCICAIVPRIETTTRYLVLQHALEHHKSTNTGRPAALALVNASLGFFGGQLGDLDLATVDLSNAAVLFPGEGASVPSPAPRLLVVLDGNWSQARRMFQRIPELRALPRLSLSVHVEADRLREVPFAGGLSTIEAIAEAVRILDGDPQADALHALHREFVRRIKFTRGGPPPVL